MICRPVRGLPLFVCYPMARRNTEDPCMHCHVATEFHDAPDQGMAAARLQAVTMAPTDTDASDQICADILTDKTQKVG